MKQQTKELNSLYIGYIQVLVFGKIIKTGDASLSKEIEQNGYEAYKK